MTIELDVYEALLARSLERGVPVDAVADIFELPVETVREMAKEVKIRRFNTSDRDEYLEFIQWETLERVQSMIRHGSAEQVARISTTVLGRQIAAAGRRPSSDTEERRAELMSMFAGIRDAPAEHAGAGRFVVGRTDIDRRAHQSEGDDDE